MRGLVFGPADGAAAAELRGADFSHCTLEDCVFTEVDLDHVSFKEATVIDCDFRYATFRRARLTGATFRRCDFYRANFRDGTELQRARFELISPPDNYEGVTGLRWETFAGEDSPALVGESRADYERFLERTEGERSEDRSIEKAMRERYVEAADAYLTLSAFWDGRGPYEDAAKAYARSKRLLRRSVSPWSRDTDTDLPRWLWLWFSDLACGFGDGLWRVALTLACVAVLPALLFWALGDVRGCHGIGDDLLYSVAHLTPDDAGGMAPADRGAEIIGFAQMVAGIALLGLFGFVLGNRIRRS